MQVLPAGPGGGGESPGKPGKEAIYLSLSASTASRSGGGGGGKPGKARERGYIFEPSASSEVGAESTRQLSFASCLTDLLMSLKAIRAYLPAM